MKTYIHDKCEGAVDVIEQGYGLCTECGDEGEFTATEENEAEGYVLVRIPSPTCNRHSDFQKEENH